MFTSLFIILGIFTATCGIGCLVNSSADSDSAAAALCNIELKAA